jgi:integrase/recombinase XerD
MVLVDTGIRAGELCGLQMNHVSLTPTDAHIKVFGKGDKWREVGMGERCRKELRRFVNKHRDAEKGTEATVFRTRRGEPLTERGLFGIIQRLGREAKITGVRCSPHTLRYTYAVASMRESGDIYRLSKLMGHTSIRITENYLKSFTQADARRGAVSPLDVAF